MVTTATLKSEVSPCKSVELELSVKFWIRSIKKQSPQSQQQEYQLSFKRLNTASKCSLKSVYSYAYIVDHVHCVDICLVMTVWITIDSRKKIKKTYLVDLCIKLSNYIWDYSRAKSFTLHIYFSSLFENQNSQYIGKRIKHYLDLSFRVYQKLLYKLPIL